MKNCTLCTGNVHPMDVFYPAIEYSLRIEYRVMTRLSDISAGQYYVNMLAALHKLKTYSIIWRKGWTFFFFFFCRLPLYFDDARIRNRCFNHSCVIFYTYCSSMNGIYFLFNEILCLNKICDRRKTL